MSNTEIPIDKESFSEFVMTDDFSIIHAKRTDMWFIEDYEEEGMITILFEKGEFITPDDFEYRDIPISHNLIKKFMDITNKENSNEN
jgi:hypothetical protein